MVYMGSKAGISKILVPFLQKIIDDYNIHIYYEPFVGGANIIDKIKCDTKIGIDKSESLIALLTVARDNFEKIPTSCSREEFEKAKNIYLKKTDDTLPDYIIGAYQFLGSYGAKGFKGGYAPNDKNGRCYYNERLNNLKKQSDNLKDCHFLAGDYDKYSYPSNCLIVCDPPYEGTQTYSYAHEVKFNYEKYWNWVREQSKDKFVVCCEEHFPDDFLIIKEIPKRRTIKKDNSKIAMEKIGIWKNGLLAKNLNF